MTRGKYRTVQFLREGLKIPDILEKYTKELEELSNKLAQSKADHPKLTNPTNCELWMKHAWGKDWETSCFIWYCNISFLLNWKSIHDDDLIGISTITNELREKLSAS